MQAYEGYFENGRFFPIGPLISIQGRRRVILTVLDEPIADNENAEAWLVFLREIRRIEDEPLQEFERVKFREVDI